MPDTTMAGQGQGQGGGLAPQTDQIPEVREYLYVTICGGDFSQGSKSAAMNVSIAAYCLSNDGAVIPNCIARGTGKQSPLVSNYATSVYYHVNNPVINETFHIDLNAVPNLLNSHLLITVSHCSTNTATATSSRQSESFFGASKDKKARSVVGFCVLPFMDQKRGGVVVNALSRVQFEKNCHDARRAVHRAAIRQMIFWLELSEITPDITRLFNLAEEIDTAVQEAEVNFAAIFVVSPQALTQLRLYAAFNLHVTGNLDKASALTAEADRAEDAQSKDHRNEGLQRLQIMADSSLELFTESTAIVTLAASQRDLGVVVRIRSGCARE
jgi:hypothetical protein